MMVVLQILELGQRGFLDGRLKTSPIIPRTGLTIALAKDAHF